MAINTGEFSGALLRMAGGSVLALAASMPAIALAQDTGASGPEATSQDIVVTARRTTERLQDIPVAVTAISQEQLTASGIETVADLPLLTTGLQTGISPFDATNVQFKLRGQSQSGGQGESSVGVYVDGVFLTKTFGLAGALFDLERIEVLKGPQGTLYGKNTSGGAVSIITRKPDLDEFGGFIDATA